MKKNLKFVLIFLLLIFTFVVISIIFLIYYNNKMSNIAVTQDAKSNKTPTIMNLMIRSNSTNEEEPIVSELHTNFQDAEVDNTSADNIITEHILSNASFGPMLNSSDHMNQFSSSDKQLWLTVKFSNKIIDDVVYFVLQHEAENSSLGPVKSAILSENDGKHSVFRLSSPESGWPVGTYTAVISLQSGDTETFTFQMY
jgi:hypothetical protein